MENKNRKSILNSVKINLLIISIDFILSIIILLIYNIDLFQVIRNFFITSLLIEAGICFLIGGLIVYRGTIFVNRLSHYLFKSEAEWSPEIAKNAEKSSFFYLLLATLLFLESIILSLTI